MEDILEFYDWNMYTLSEKDISVLASFVYVQLSNLFNKTFFTFSLNQN